MQIDSDDHVLHADKHAPRQGLGDADALAVAARSAWAAAFAPTVEVVVKKRRLVSLEDTAGGHSTATRATAAAEPSGGERGPRVFVLPKDPALVPPADAAAAATDVPGSGPRRRRRANLGQRPSPVVHIVVPAPEAAFGPQPVRAAHPEADAPFALPMPAHDEYEAIQAALAQLHTILQQAQRAQVFALKLPGR
jgi:hypothetical protein